MSKRRRHTPSRSSASTPRARLLAGGAELENEQTTTWVSGHEIVPGGGPSSGFAISRLSDLPRTGATVGGLALAGGTRPG